MSTCVLFEERSDVWNAPFVVANYEFHVIRISHSHSSRITVAETDSDHLLTETPSKCDAAGDTSINATPASAMGMLQPILTQYCASFSHA